MAAQTASSPSTTTTACNPPLPVDLVSPALALVPPGTSLGISRANTPKQAISDGVSKAPLARGCCCDGVLIGG